jgi:hypothetical protein
MENPMSNEDAKNTELTDRRQDAMTAATEAAERGDAEAVAAHLVSAGLLRVVVGSTGLRIYRPLAPDESSHGS